MKPKEYLTEEQMDFIIANAGKKYISEMSRRLKVPDSRIRKFLVTNNIDFKMTNGRKSTTYFPEGCFNPHERENWLV